MGNAPDPSGTYGQEVECLPFIESIFIRKMRTEAVDPQPCHHMGKLPENEVRIETQI